MSVYSFCRDCGETADLELSLYEVARLKQIEKNKEELKDTAPEFGQLQCDATQGGMYVVLKMIHGLVAHINFFLCSHADE